MRLNTNTFTLVQALRTHRQIILFVGSYTVFVILATCVLWSLFGMQKIQYSYAEHTVCTASPKLLPQLFTSSHDKAFRLDRAPSLSVFGQPLYSHRFCITPARTPQPQTETTVREAFLGLMPLGKPVKVNTQSYALVHAAVPADKAVPVDKPLYFKLDRPDETFTYAVRVNTKTSNCTHVRAQLSCDISRLGLQHAKTYDLQIIRSFGDKTVGKALSQKTETLTPIMIVNTSIASSSTVYEQPTQLTFETDKPIDTLETFKLTAKDAAGAETPLSAKVTTKDKTITAIFDKPLPRKQTLTAHIEKLHATDGSGLSGPSYDLSFTTSGGPTVTGTNTGKFAIDPGQTITVTFDQPLAVSQNWGGLASLTVNGQAANASYSVQGNKLRIDPAGNFPACGRFVIKLTGDIQSPHGVGGDSSWTFNSRARCAVISSIGASAKGRAITSYRFGSGGNPVVYIGTIHGNETSAKVLMDNWLNELEANADTIPAGRSIVVIPVTNPDGFAAKSRLNANGVDLNRNFPSNDWKATVTIPGGKTLPIGGGATSLSEPESQALAAFVQRERPRLLLTYHAKASIIEANEAGDSMSIAYLYAKTSRYRAVSKSQNASFQHDTTGALEDWMRDKLGLPALCIELATQSGNEFSRNKEALWAMAKL